MLYIYKILNNINGKFYIGSTTTKNGRRRWYAHKYLLNKNKHYNYLLQKAWNKYKKENFEFIIIDECEDEDTQFDLEQSYFDKLQPFYPNGYNLSKTSRSGVIGFYKKGENHHSTKLNDEDVCKIKIMLSEGLSVRKISKQMDMEAIYISNIKFLVSHKDVLKELNDDIVKYIKKAKTEEEKEKDFNNAVKLFKLKYTNKKISEELNIGQHLVRQYIYKYKNLKMVSKCISCGCEIIKKSNNQKYCKKCSKKPPRQ